VTERERGLRVGGEKRYAAMKHRGKTGGHPTAGELGEVGQTLTLGERSSLTKRQRSDSINWQGGGERLSLFMGKEWGILGFGGESSIAGGWRCTATTSETTERIKFAYQGATPSGVLE